MLLLIPAGILDSLASGAAEVGRNHLHIRVVVTALGEEGSPEAGNLVACASVSLGSITDCSCSIRVTILRRVSLRWWAVIPRRRRSIILWLWRSIVWLLRWGVAMLLPLAWEEGHDSA